MFLFLFSPNTKTAALPDDAFHLRHDCPSHSLADAAWLVLAVNDTLFYHSHHTTFVLRITVAQCTELIVSAPRLRYPTCPPHP